MKWLTKDEKMKKIKDNRAIGLDNASKCSQRGKKRETKIRKKIRKLKSI